MHIDHTHSEPLFYPLQMKNLMAEQRVHVLEIGQPMSADYPYVVLAEPLSRTSNTRVRAWFVNAVGKKDPAVRMPSAVDRRELMDVDFANEEVRRPIADYAAGREQTFVFGLADVPATSDAYHHRALGVGVDQSTAAADAAARLVERYPGLLSPKRRSSDDLGVQAALLEALQSKTAVLHHVQRIGYPRQAQMGHEYMSNETYLVASALQSDGDLCAKVAAMVERSIVKFQSAAHTQTYRLMKSMNMAAAMVDWGEVASGFPEVVAERQIAKPVVLELVPEGATPPAAAEPVEGRSIEPAVLEVLRRSVVEGRELRLPAEKLPPNLYKRVNEVLVALGGKWIGRKVQAHVFDEDVGPVMEVVLATGTYIRPKDFGYFPTPAALVRRLLDEAAIEPNMLVMEPSAGQGAIAIPLSDAVGGRENVTVCEFLPGNASKLREAGFGLVLEGDFLELEPEPIYDRVVMNPPFGGGADIAHVMHAARFLKPDGRLVAITSPAWTWHSNKKSVEFRAFVEEVAGTVSSIENGAFRESGTDIATRMLTLDAENFPWNKETDVRRERMRG